MQLGGARSARWWRSVWDRGLLRGTRRGDILLATVLVGALGCARGGADDGEASSPTPPPEEASGNVAAGGDSPAMQEDGPVAPELSEAMELGASSQADAGLVVDPLTGADPLPTLLDSADPEQSDQESEETPEELPQAGTTLPAGGSEAEQSDCVAGSYTGAFSGNVVVLGLLNIPISGTVEVSLGAASVGNSLVFEDAVITGSDQDGNPISAEVKGVLNCDTLLFEDAVLENGVYRRESLNQTVNFDGVIDASYVPGAVPKISGSWSTDGGLESGSGPFNAVFFAP